MGRSLYIIGLSVLLAASARADVPGVQFVHVSPASGIGPYVMAGGMGGGVAAADVDGDGFVDLFVPNALGVPDQFYHNLGDGQFAEIAAEVGLASLDQSRVGLWFDYDADGALDLLVANDGEKAPSTYRLYRQRSSGLFEDVTVAAGLFLPMPPPIADTFRHRGGLAAGDFNNDGYLDVVSAQWNGLHHLFLNNTDGTFSDISQSSGINAAFHFGHQPVIADFNGDGWQDIYMAVDFQGNVLLINQGDATFVDLAPQVHAGNAMNDMGVTLGDHDNDGDLDIYITNIYIPDKHNVLLCRAAQQPKMHFDEISQTLGVDNGGWGWGTTFFDADNDGWLDIAATNGWYLPKFANDRSKFFWNRGVTPVRYADRSAEANFNDDHWGSALVALDYDRDGSLDLVQTCMDGPLRLLHNRATPGVQRCNWLVIQPRMPDGPNSRAIGAVVRIRVGQQRQMRVITAGTSYLGQEPAEAVFGVGTAETADSVIVAWPDGTQTCLDNVPTKQLLIVEPRDEQRSTRPTRACRD